MSVPLTNQEVDRETGAATPPPGPEVREQTGIDADVTGPRRGRDEGGITLLKRADQAYDLMTAIVENAHDAIVSKDLNGIINSWNEGARRLFGYRADEVIGKPITIIIPPDRQDEEAAILARIRQGERVQHYDTVRRRKDGSLVDVSLTISPIRDVHGKVIGASKIARDICERKQAQARQELLAREIQHRTRNLFAVVQAVASVSFAGKKTVKDAEAAVLSRLTSLAQTHAMLINSEWEGADIDKVVEVEMGPYAGRVKTAGPKVRLKPKAAQNLGLALHELATNAAKYGALSNAAGWVEISWAIGQSDGSRRLAFRWQEHDGPRVKAPIRKGFGTRVLEHVMAEYVSEPPRIDFVPDGVTYALEAPFDAMAVGDTSSASRDGRPAAA